MRHRPHIFGLCLALASAGGACAAHAATWIMIPEASTLRFAGTQTGTGFTGQFRRFETRIVLDPANLSTAEIDVVIHTNSIASGSPDRDSDALTNEWFHTALFPEASFTSSEVVHVEANAYLALGTLEIKGIGRAIALPFTLDIEGDGAVADGTLALDRLDYDVGRGSEYEDDAFVGHQVTVSFHIEATRAE